MRVINLVEDTPGADGCTPAHGLAFYIETKRHRLLMDAGPGDVTALNADALGVDLTRVDTVVLSHGHYDHADGLPAIARRCPGAAVYLRRAAGMRHYSDDGASGMRYIGVASGVLSLPGLVYVDGTLRIDDELTLFGDITGRRYWPQANLRLRRCADGEYVQDGFDHEQCLILTESGRRVLLSGCAHSGILNILERYREVFGGAPDVVVSGFHMMKKGEYAPRELETIRETATALATYPARFLTCHCTGIPAFQMMKQIMGDQLDYIHCGQEVPLDRKT